MSEAQRVVQTNPDARDAHVGRPARLMRAAGVFLAGLLATSVAGCAAPRSGALEKALDPIVRAHG